MGAACDRRVGEATERAIMFCEIPSPTHSEQARASAVAEALSARGYAVTRDETGNVYVRRTGTSGKAVLVNAHMDTVFPAGTDVRVRREASILRAPGIGDNCLNLSAMISILDILDELKIETQNDIVFCGNVCEEGLGNLKGAWAAVRRYQHELVANVVVDGHAGHLITAAVGSRRFEVIVNGPGGHSYGAFGAPSAIHGLARGIAAVANLAVPVTPKTTYNVGLLSGGTSINTIAAEARAVVDVRSEEAGTLAAFGDEIQRRFMAEAGHGLVVKINIVGERPAGRGAEDHPLVHAALQALRDQGFLEVSPSASSTDANVPISLGIPSVCVGTYTGDRAHSLDEWADVSGLGGGMATVARIILAAADIS